MQTKYDKYGIINNRGKGSKYLGVTKASNGIFVVSYDRRGLPTKTLRADWKRFSEKDAAIVAKFIHERLQKPKNRRKYNNELVTSSSGKFLMKIDEDNNMIIRVII